MTITYWIFALSFTLFASYTVVSLRFLRKKRDSWKKAVQSLAEVKMIDYFGRLIPDPEIALSILEDTNDKYKAYIAEEEEVQSNIIKLALLTMASGIFVSLSIFMM